MGTNPIHEGSSAMTKSPLEAVPPDTTTFGGKDFNIMGFPGSSDSNEFT